MSIREASLSDFLQGSVTAIVVCELLVRCGSSVNLRLLCFRALVVVLPLVLFG